MTQTNYTMHINPIIQTLDIQEVINYLRQHGVLRYEMHCGECNQRMRQVKRSSAPDNFAFRCYVTSCRKYQHHMSIRHGSILQNLKITLQKFIHAVYLYSREMKQKDIEEMAGISNSTLYKIIKALRIRISRYFAANPMILGGPNCVVQIDESKFNFNVKAHRGHAPRSPIWVFGIVDTSFSPARGYMQIVERRDKETLIGIIQAHVRPYTVVNSDEWAAYASLSNHHYVHNTVCHKYNFVNPETGTHTQHVESYWNRQKLRIKKAKGLIASAMPAVIEEYMFFDLMHPDIFVELLKLSLI